MGWSGLLGGQMLGLWLERLGCSLAVSMGTRVKMLGGRSASVVWCPQVAVALCLENLPLVSGPRKNCDRWS